MGKPDDRTRRVSAPALGFTQVISTAGRFIFLHVPKTGGNSMTLMLLPHSDDRMVAGSGPGATDRFGVQGPQTPDKHAMLQDYADRLEGGLQGWRVALTARDPMARAVSYYFSPHRWNKGDEAGRTAPVWDRKTFRVVIRQMATLAEFMTVYGKVRRPDHLIRQERLAEDFAAFVRAVGLPLDAGGLPKVNASAATSALHQEALEDPVAREAVRLRFAADYQLLEAWASEQRLVA